MPFLFTIAVAISIANTPILLSPSSHFHHECKLRFDLRFSFSFVRSFVCFFSESHIFFFLFFFFFPFIHVESNAIISQLHQVFDEEYHSHFEALSHLMTYDTTFKEELTLIHTMSNSSLTTPVFLDPFDDGLSIPELFEKDFFDEIPVENTTTTAPVQEDKDLICSQISGALTDAGFEQEEILSVINHFSNNKDKGPNKLHQNTLARAHAFPSYESVICLLSDSSLTDITSKNITIPLTPHYLVSLITTHSNLLSNHASPSLSRHAYSYLKLYSTNRDDKTPISPQESNLREIRTRTAANGRVFFFKKAKTISLEKFSKGTPNYSRCITRRYTSSVVKLLQTHREEQEHAHGPPFPFNCFICSAISCEADEQLLDTSTDQQTDCCIFKSDTISPRTNVLRIIPYDSEKSAVLHLRTYHLNLLHSAFMNETHLFFIPCFYCLKASALDPLNTRHITNSFSCCHCCLITHFNILHKGESPLASCHTSLARRFAHSPSALDVISSMLEVECYTCGEFFALKRERDQHASRCQISKTLRCNKYGEPLSLPHTFQSKHLLQLHTTNLQAHCKTQVEQLYKKLTTVRTPKHKTEKTPDTFTDEQSNTQQSFTQLVQDQFADELTITRTTTTTEKHSTPPALSSPIRKNKKGPLQPDGYAYRDDSPLHNSSSPLHHSSGRLSNCASDDEYTDTTHRKGRYCDWSD